MPTESEYRIVSAALIVIDMQVALLHGAYQAPRIIENTAGLIRRAREAGMPVIYVQHNHATFEPMKKGSPGWQIHDSLKPLPSDTVVEKEASDAFYGTDLAITLQDLSVTEVVISGMMTEYCVDTTARSALSNGFDVVLAGDAHTTGDSVLQAAEIIAHHNAVLPNVVHPTRRIRVIPSDSIAMSPPGDATEPGSRP